MNERAPHCVAANDPWLREAVGAYLLGALEPVENDRVAAHLAVCASCRAEYGELAELLPLLASVTEAEAVNGPVKPEAAVLGRVLATTSQLQDAYTQQLQQPGRRRWWGGRSGAASTGTNGTNGTRARTRTRIAMAAGAAVLVAGGTGVAMMMSSGGADLPAGSWKAVAIAGGTDYVDHSADHIQATVEVSPAKSGSTIHLTMDNVPAGYSCTMVVVGTTGQHEPTGTWKANTEGSFAIPGWSYMTPDSISSIQVDLPDGSTLLTLKHPR